MQELDKLTPVEAGYESKTSPGKWNRCRFCEFVQLEYGNMASCNKVQGRIYLDGHCSKLVVADSDKRMHGYFAAYDPNHT